MKLIVLSVTAAIALAAYTGVANAQEALAKSSGCLNCHAVDTKTGPGLQGDRREVQRQGRCRGNARDQARQRQRTPGGQDERRR